MNYFQNLSVRWKVLIIAMIAPVIITLVITIQRIGDIRHGSEKEILSKSKIVVLMAESIRDQMSVKIDKGLLKPFKDIDKQNILDAVPVISAIKVAEENAEEAGYKFRVPKINARNPKNEPDEVELKVLKELEEGNISEKIVENRNEIRYFRPIKLTKECLFCHGDKKGEKDVLGYEKEGWREGEVHGAFEIISSKEEANKAVLNAQINSFIFALIMLFLTGSGTWLLLQANLIKPLNVCSEFIKTIAGGILTERMKLKNRDEFSTIVSALNSMADNLCTIIKEISEKASVLSGSSLMLNDVSSSLAREADQTLSLSNSVATAAEEMSTNMTSVAAATEETSTSVERISLSGEELKSAITEIAEKSERARLITNTGVAQSQTASSKIYALEQSVQEINKITETITDISDQINLLALNATIEAARAGEAGKGFAVVANEVKSLSRQTADATQDIRKKIEGIQTSTRMSMDEIKEVSRIIEEISQIVYTVASAVEEQSATTNEIATAISQGAQGIQEVSRHVSESSVVANEIARDIGIVHKSTGILAQNSNNLKEKAEELKEIGSNLTVVVQKFKI